MGNYYEGTGGDKARGVFAASWNKKSLRQLNELDNAGTVSTSRKETDAKWKLDPKGVMSVLEPAGGGVS